MLLLHQIFFLANIKMAGGLMQLVAYGAQDVYLTGKPTVTFFQAVYKRHTNFAMETIQQTINGTVANSQRISVTVARNGDLVGYMYAELTPATATLPNLTSSDTVQQDLNWVAERAFSSVELTIGGQRIDKHYQTWWRLFSELFLSDENKVQYNKMSSLANVTSGGTGSNSDSSNKVYLPLIFFFNRNPGLYLPLIALQYHEVRLDIDCATNYTTYFASVAPTIWANYVFLDVEERRRFAQKAHEYLIEQVQHTGGDTISGSTESSAQNIRLSFNHPVKELVWCYQNSSFPASRPQAMWNFTSNASNLRVTTDVTQLAVSNVAILPHHAGSPLLALGTLGSSRGWTEEGNAGTAASVEVGPLHQWKLVLNGQDRMKEQFGKYFNQVQPFYHHTGNPYPGIYSYSFALHPEEHQPTGTCNFSRIDNAQVQAWIKAAAITGNGGLTQKLFAVNYNILRIQSGMGGLAFSN
jgi:hypothetical protein